MGNSFVARRVCGLCGGNNLELVKNRTFNILTPQDPPHTRKIGAGAAFLGGPPHLLGLQAEKLLLQLRFVEAHPDVLSVDEVLQELSGWSGGSGRGRLRTMRGGRQAALGCQAGTVPVTSKRGVGRANSAARLAQRTRPSRPSRPALLPRPPPHARQLVPLPQHARQESGDPEAFPAAPQEVRALDRFFHHRRLLSLEKGDSRPIRIQRSRG